MQFLVRLGVTIWCVFASTVAFAHIGAGHVDTFTAGVAHPFSGLDHVAVMVAVGLWAASKGGRAVWVWPSAFILPMLVGGALGMTQVPLPFVEPAIVASVVAVGLVVALAIDLPLWLGSIAIGIFAVFHGYAHALEAPDTGSGVAYMAGFTLATALLHAVGIGFALAMARLSWRPLVRTAGALCVLIGFGLAVGVW